MNRIKLNCFFTIFMLFCVVLGSNAYNASEIESETSDLTAMSNDEIAKLLDPDPNKQDFIILSSQQLAELKGYQVTEVVAAENFSQINSTMEGEYEVYRINGHYVFCVEPGYDTLNTASEVSDSGSIFYRFSKSSQAYITKVISSALEKYGSSGDNSYIFAGQLLIWDYIGNHEADVVGNAMASWNPNYLTSWTIHKSIYNPQILEIETELGNWNVRPSFTSSTAASAKKHTLEYDDDEGQYTITLTDSNGVWDSKYANYTDYGNYTITNPKGKDNVKISSPIARTDYSSSKKYSWSPKNSDVKELYDAGQDLIYVGASPLSAYMKFNTSKEVKGGFKLEKNGEQIDGELIPVDNTKFNVVSTDDNGINRTYATDAKGQINTGAEELPLGSYHISEISAPDEYVIGFEQDFKISKKGQMVAINDGQPIINELFTNQIELKKVGENLTDDNQSPLANVSFDLYQEVEKPNQIIDETDLYIETLITDQSGIATSSQLPIGNYIIIETETNEGYQLTKQTYSFNIVNDKTTKNHQLLDLGTFINEPITGTASLQKIGVGSCQQTEDCSQPLAGVIFNIYQDINNDGEFGQDEKEVNYKIETDENGFGKSQNLKYGHYFIQEDFNPNINYQFSDKIYDFWITDDKNVEINSGIPIENQEKTGDISIKKTGKNKEPLKAAEFTLYDEQMQILAMNSSDAEGLVLFENLSFGTYFIEETKAPDGYTLNNKLYEVSIDQDNYKDGVNLEINDRVIKNQIEVSKVDAANGQELPGAELEVLDKSNGEQVQSWVSTMEPYKFEIDYGQYQICETLAPDGYKLEPKCTEFSVDEDGVTQAFKIENRQLKMALTGGNFKLYTVFTLSILILIILIVLYLRVYKQTIV